MEERRKDDSDLRDRVIESQNDIKWMRESMVRIETRLASSCTEVDVQKMISIAVDPVAKQQRAHISAHRRFVTTMWIVLGLTVTAAIGLVAHDDARAAINSTATVQPVHNKATP